jgi:hypothetical protein
MAKRVTRMARIMPATRHVKVTKFSVATVVILCASIAGAATTKGPGFQLVAQSQMQEQLPSIGLDAKGTVAIWDDSTARAGRVPPAQPISDAAQLAEGPYRDSGVASIGSESMVIWLRNDDLWGQRIGSDGKPAGVPIYIGFTDSRHTQRVAIGASRDRYLVVWGISSRVIGSLIDANGQTITFGLSMTNGEFGRNVERISVASNGSEFLVVWDASTSEPWVDPCTLACPAEDRDVHAVIVKNDGTVRTETERILATGAGDPAVATNGRDYFVTWTRFGGGLSGQSIGAGLASIGDPVAITTRLDYGPHLAWDGALYDLVWINADDGPLLSTARINDKGTIVETILTDAYSGFLSRDFDVAASGGKIALAIPTEGHLRLQFVSVTAAPPSRGRLVRH